MTKMLEKDVQNSILEYLELKGIFHTRINSGVRYFEGRAFKGAMPGFPDILCLYKGRFIGLEVKTAKTKQNPNQIAVEEMIKAHGGEYYVVRSIDDVEPIFGKQLR